MHVHPRPSFIPPGFYPGFYPDFYPCSACRSQPRRRSDDHATLGRTLRARAPRAAVALHFKADHEGEGDETDDAVVSSGPLSSSLIDEDALFIERFRRSRESLERSLRDERRRRPPSADLAPKGLVTSLLETLLRPHEVAPYFGYEVLYGCCTERWRGVLRASVGAGEGTADELVYRALSSSMERRDNQFGILVGRGVDSSGAVAVDTADGKGGDDSTLSLTLDGEDYYSIEYPWDTLDYMDGTAFVESRLRDGGSDELLCVLGWSLERSAGDGAWLVDAIDWQDFRPKYRPGVGREEWERICG